jgi:hypothetical protein
MNLNDYSDFVVAANKELMAKLARAVSVGSDPRGAISMQLADGTDFYVEAPPLRLADRLQKAVVSALYAMADLADAMKRVNGDKLLSEFGRNQQLAPVRVAAVRMVAASAGTVRAFERSVDEAERKRYAPPVTPDQFRAVMRAFEIRQGLRERSPAEVLKLIDGALDDGEQRELLAAVLDAPVGQFDQVREYARQEWRKLVNRDDPAGAIALADDRVAIEWADRALGHIAGRTQQFARFSRADLAEMTGGSDGYQVFGLGADEAAQGKAAADRKVAAAKAA